MLRYFAAALGRVGSRQIAIAQPQVLHRTFRTTAACSDLMEFFDDKKNWGEMTVRTGRAWKIDELRLKSNVDLHKLWYILLKEKNMLLTMEHEAKRECMMFPNPERIDKVEESMENLENVVRERNRAYFLLETGETGERPGGEVINFLGLPEYVQYDEYAVPKEENKEYLKAKAAEPKSSPTEKVWFLTRWRLKLKKEARRAQRRQQYQVLHILRNYPDCDKVALQEQFPDVKVDRYVARLKERNCENLVNYKMKDLVKLPLRL